MTPPPVPNPVDTRDLPPDAVAKLLAVSRRLAETADLEQVLSTVIDALRDLLDAERATVFEYDANTDELFTQVAHGLGDREGTIRIPSSRGIAGAAATSRQIVNIPDAYADERFNREVDIRTGFRTRSILAIPLVDHDGGLVGVAQVLNRDGGPFRAVDEQLAAGLAAQAAVALRRGRLIEDRVARERMERDLMAARSIQQSSFPRDLPAPPGWQIAAAGEPAEQCGGDAFDVVPLRRGEIVEPDAECDEMVLLVADATGHGIGSALSAMQARAMLRLGLRLRQPMDRIVSECNRQLCQDLPMGRFVTAWFARVHLHSGLVESVAAGQGPVLHYRRATDDFVTLPTDLPPMGVVPEDLPAERTELILQPGDLLVALTDGYFESEGPGGEQWLQQRCEALIRRDRDLDPSAILAACNAAMTEWCSGAPAADDRTAIVLKRIG
ncbi:MAG: GAF domain-containing protein [Planctomycetes bacterium]|nr:GAF domain-containing protein [Planctomycetota bacterium]